jgi:leucyl/phenylalanyl-tRNA--protein transferase
MELTPDLLLKAYTVGVFPMAESRDDPVLHWIDPELRGVLPLDAVHIPRKLKRRIRQGDFDVRCDTAFGEVIRHCAAPAEGRPDTWINPTIERLYNQVFARGFAHSVECWQDGKLFGGLYGVSLGAVFFGESMFSRVSDASKVALMHLAMRLRKGGFGLLDTQFNTPHLSRFGVLEIPRDEYQKQLVRAVNTQARFPTEVTREEIEAFLQSSAPPPRPL